MIETFQELRDEGPKILEPLVSKDYYTYKHLEVWFFVCISDVFPLSVSWKDILRTIYIEMCGSDSETIPIANTEELIQNLSALSGVLPLLTPPKLQPEADEKSEEKNDKKKKKKKKSEEEEEEEQGGEEEEEGKEGEEEENTPEEEAPKEEEAEEGEAEEDEAAAERERLRIEAETQKPAVEVFGEFDADGSGMLTFPQVWHVFKTAYLNRHLKPLTINEEEVCLLVSIIRLW